MAAASVHVTKTTLHVGAASVHVPKTTLHVEAATLREPAPAGQVSAFVRECLRPLCHSDERIGWIGWDDVQTDRTASKRLIRRRMLEPIDDEHVEPGLRRLELQSQLLL